MKQQVVAAIHDMAGMGRCSLTVIIPLLSAMGVQVCPVPTAMLSTHLGGFGSPAMEDLSDYIPKTLVHYKELGISFDAVYTGFLAHKGQVDFCKEFLATYPTAIHLVDPVMADDGEVYSSVDESLQREMKELVKKADIITPNLTEAFLLLGRDYTAERLERSAYEEMMRELSAMGSQEVLLKGITFDEGTLTNLLYNKKEDRFAEATCRKIPQSYPGTGDMFASVYLGGLLSGKSSPSALLQATNFLEYAIDYTYKLGTEPRYGIALEPCLQWFYK